MLPSIPSHAQYQSFGAFFDVVTGASRVGTACASLACPDAVTLRFGRANTLRTYRTRSLRHPQATQNRPPLVTAPVDILHSFTYPSFVYISFIRLHILILYETLRTRLRIN